MSRPEAQERVEALEWARAWVKYPGKEHDAEKRVARFILQAEERIAELEIACKHHQHIWQLGEERLREADRTIEVAMQQIEQWQGRLREAEAEKNMLRRERDRARLKRIEHYKRLQACEEALREWETHGVWLHGKPRPALDTDEKPDEHFPISRLGL